MMIFLLDWAASYIASYYEPLFIEFTSRLPVDFALMERAANSGYRYVTVGVGTDGGTFAYGDTYYVYMAKGALSDGCTKSEYNKAAYVLEVKDMFHENEHIWQYTKAWNDKQNMNVIKSYRRITDTVRRMFIIPVDGGSLNL